jgi:uncharacterized radical SAM superfamily Fe-S cluster-containing enzyme
MTERQAQAYKLLSSKYKGSFSYLGEGSSSVVFTDNRYVYKVISFLNEFSYQENYKHIISSVQHKFNGSRHFYEIKELVELKDENRNFILIYPYEESTPCTAFNQSEIQEFLVECWQKRVIFKDIKPKNFIRVDGRLKWIDYDPDTFTDNLFLNMAARAFIYTKYSNKSKAFLTKLCRSAINNFDLPELQGFHDFTNTLFARIIFQESQIEEGESENLKAVSEVAEIRGSGSFKLPYKDSFNAEKAFWTLNEQKIYLDRVSFENTQLDEQNHFSPKNVILKTQKIIEPKQKVSLVIKACVQDAEVVYEAVKHIVKQLSFPNIFDEKVLALDIREADFLREYNSENSWERLIEESQRLVDELIIDKFILPNKESFSTINKKWFGLETNATHTTKKVPVVAQLYAFEKTKNDFVLQMDCDVMIGRLSKEHSFLDDMILEIDKNENVLSVGFNIYKGKETSFTSYFGFENGGFIPEVRFCMFKKSRIERVLPLKNEVVGDTLKLSWYRALEQKQRETRTYSIRGGDSRSFYIHPHNFKKTDRDVWFTTLDRVEQLQIPKNQINEFDLAGSYYDWTLAKRNEKLVVVSCFRNIPLSQFLRYWYSLTSQKLEDWGLILIDDASDNGISYFIKELIKPFQDRVTFIQNRFRVGVAKNTYKAIHYFMDNQDSVVCVVDADDALIGKNALKSIFGKYSDFDADVVIGKMYRTDKLHAHYKYTPNFINPRLYGGNVWQHIRSFKKYLFDSLSFEDLKIVNRLKKTDDILLAKRFSHKMLFPEHCWDFTYMIPIVEMSRNPMWVNYFNVFHDRTTENTKEVKKRKEEIISEVLAKPRKSERDALKGRKTFLPNLNQIEIDITYECNLKCINCNRSSTQAPIKEGMTLEQIQKFVLESIELNKKWKLINLLGGEPSIHKDFLEIVRFILNEYIIKNSPETILQITSNGFGDLVQGRLSELPKHTNLVIDYASFKDTRIVPYFSPFNDAPIDKPKGNEKEYHKGCWVTSYCGIGLNQLGYYPCGVAGGIDRVFNFKLGVQSLKDVDGSIARYLDTFCRFCGNFSDYETNFGNFIPRNEKAALTKPITSESWRKAYKDYNGKQKSDSTSKRRN